MYENKDFDVVIVGGGITGGIIAKELGAKGDGLKILVLEAGNGAGFKYSEYQKYNDKFYNESIKIPNSPYTDSNFAKSPSVLDPKQMTPESKPDTDGYFVQNGPFPFLSNYNRNLGGTTLHWLGTTLRMCPNDFKMKTLYGHGVDWPMTYEDLMPYYRRAEKEIGVAAEVEDQAVLGIKFKQDYVFPMHKIPQSYLDNYMSEKLGDTAIKFDGEIFPMRVVSTPQGRNGMPNHKYVDDEGNKGFEPVGAVGAPNLGLRCEGNSNCVPICPVQAKYSALKTLYAASQSEKSTVEFWNEAVVSTIEINPEDNNVKCVHYTTYETDKDGKGKNPIKRTVSGKYIILAANAIENAKILLASNACTSSGQVGRNLMDHLVMLTWGLMPDAIGSLRGPGSTSGMPLVRDGVYRKNRAAFRVEIGNWGWNWPANTPESTLLDAISGNFKSGIVDAPKGKPLYGKKLREYIKKISNRQFRMGWEIEQLPSSDNYISISEDYKDDLGNHRPIIHYNINDYEKKAAVEAMRMSQKLFRTLNVTDYTHYRTDEPGYFEYDGEGYVVNGAGHVVGCHKMGNNPLDSVVDTDQRAHDHKNLFVAGCGSMPTSATANPTLTMAALAYKTADAILAEYKKEKEKA